MKGKNQKDLFKYKHNYFFPGQLSTKHTILQDNLNNTVTIFDIYLYKYIDIYKDIDI